MKKIVLLSALTLAVFAAEIESLRPVNLVANALPSNSLTGLLFGQKIKINKSDYNTITLEEGFCDTKSYGYRTVITNDRITKKLVYDSCQEKEFLIDKNESLKEYPLAVFPDKIEKVNLDTNNPFLPTDPDTNDSSDPFKGEEPVTPTEPTEPTTPTGPPVTPTEPEVPTTPTEPEVPTTPVEPPVTPTEPEVPTTPTEPVVPPVPVVPEPPQYVYDYTPLNFSEATAKNTVYSNYVFWKYVSSEQYTENMNKILIDSIYKYYEKTKGIDKGREEAELLFKQFREPYLKGKKYNYSQEEDKILTEDMIVPTLSSITIYDQVEAKSNNGIYNFANTDIGYGAISFRINEICNGPCSSDKIVTFDNKEAYDSFIADFYAVRQIPFSDNFVGFEEKIKFTGDFCAYFKEGTVNKTKCFKQAALTDAINENFEKYVRSANIPGYGGGLGNFGFSLRTWRFATSEEFLFRIKKSLNSVARFANSEKKYEVSYINFYDKSINNSTYPNGYMRIIYKAKIRNGSTYSSVDSYADISYKEIDNIENTQAREQLLTLIRSL
jgi:hypothetical protein